MFDEYLASGIADGLLHDVTKAAHAAGIQMHAAMTGDAWADTVEWTPETQERKNTLEQTETARLAAVMAAVKAVVAEIGHPTLTVELTRIPARGDTLTERRTELHIEIGPGLGDSLVMMICRPYEAQSCTIC